jgi:asparagine synthase (glutamine-hydrolysing)
MCGIAGAYGPRPSDRARLEAAARALHHRGPDGVGIYTDSSDAVCVGLVHRRLAIIDPEPRSNQPFRLGGNSLVFNGEIYNYVEVRRELESLGHHFETSGDTEVLARALREWGENALDRLEGMWAFAWYDETQKTLLLSRDRFGEKPLYLWQTAGTLYFASEIKALAALAGDWPRSNENHLSRFLVNGYKSLYKTRELFFDEVTELEPGCWLKLDRGEQVQRRYWVSRPEEDVGLSYADAVEATREALINAVRLRMRADVPLAFCMSGGIDSNSLISVARRVLNLNVHGFTIVNTDARYEEQAEVKAAVEDLDIRHTSVRLERASFLENLRELVAAHDAPVYTISYYVHWQLMQAVAAEGYKVAISGTAADELFTGYYDHHNLYLHDVRSQTDLHRRSVESWRKHQLPLVRNPYLRDPDLYLKDPTFRGHIYLNNHEFAGWLHERWEESFCEVDYGVGLLRNRMMNELFVEAVPVILHEDDLNAMYLSIENRSPFLDRRLFEVAASIPTAHLIQDARAKAVLRDAMRGIVPDEILDNRRKVGFNAPIFDLLDVNDNQVRSYLLDDSPIYDLVRKDAIEQLLAQDELPNSASKFLFNFIGAKMFLENQQSRLAAAA